jgi:NAD-dependent SIR2 family protein deacetylase
MVDNFTCDNCGNDFPLDQMKEVKTDKTGDKTLKLCPTCLDEKMNSAEAVYGIDGEVKNKAAYLATESDDTPGEPVTGERE